MSDAIVLLSGGIDSATALAMTRATGRRCHALSFRYGQRHAVELAAAARVAVALGAASHEIIDLDLRAIGGSALTADIAVPKGRSEAEIGSGIPVTYVPARNTIFLAYAIALAEVRGASEIVVGVNVLDSSGYPDCRPEWLAAMQEVARLGTKAGVERRPVTIRAPLIKMSKAEIIRAGVKLGIDYGLTHSCYDPAPSGAACGACDSCQLRRRGFEAAERPRPDHLRGTLRGSRRPRRLERQSARELQGPPKAPVPRKRRADGATQAARRCARARRGPSAARATRARRRRTVAVAGAVPRHAPPPPPPRPTAAIATAVAVAIAVGGTAPPGPVRERARQFLRLGLELGVADRRRRPRR